MNRVKHEARASKARVENYLREQDVYFRKKKEMERLKMRVGLLQKQLQQRERLEKEGGAESLQLEEGWGGADLVGTFTAGERECGIVGGAAAVELVIQKLAAIEDVVVLTAGCICCTFENFVD